MQKRRFGAVAAVFMGIVAALLAFELFLEFVDRSGVDQGVIDEVSGLSHKKPDASYVESRACYSNIAKTNSLGFHAPEPPSLEKTADEFRIVVVGSSFVEGGSVSVDDMFTSQLERLLNANHKYRFKYEVIPIAFSGNGEYLDNLYYLRYGRPLKPDLVINLNTEFESGRDGASGNYFDANGKLTTKLEAPPTDSSIARAKNLVKNSKLAYSLYSRFFTLLATHKAEANFEALEDPSVRKAQWEMNAKLVKAMAKSVSEDKAKLLLSSWPSPQASPEVARELHDNLSRNATTVGFPYLDLKPAVDEQVQKTGIPAEWPCDWHWSADGNRYVAQALYDFLISHPLLIIRPS